MLLRHAFTAVHPMFTDQNSANRVDCPRWKSRRRNNLNLPVKLLHPLPLYLLKPDRPFQNHRTGARNNLFRIGTVGSPSPDIRRGTIRKARGCTASCTAAGTCSTCPGNSGNHNPKKTSHQSPCARYKKTCPGYDMGNDWYRDSCHPGDRSL